MPFYKVPMEGGLYKYIIVEEAEDSNGEDWFERAHSLELIFGEPDWDAPGSNGELIVDPLKEPYPVFTEAFFAAIEAERDARYKAMNESKAQG